MRLKGVTNAGSFRFLVLARLRHIFRIFRLARVLKVFRIVRMYHRMAHNNFVLKTIVSRPLIFLLVIFLLVISVSSALLKILEQVRYWTYYHYY